MLALFVVCFLMGVVAVPAGIGGGTPFVPIVGSFFAFHLDFVRSAGLLVALASASSTGCAMVGLVMPAGAAHTKFDVGRRIREVHRSATTAPWPVLAGHRRVLRNDWFGGP